jgi:hypothetical protein
MGLAIRWVTIDTPTPQALAPFWEQLLGWARDPAFDDDHEVALVAPGASGDAPTLRGLLLFRSDSPTPGKNRVHLDLVADRERAPDGDAVAARDAEVERALELGASRADIGQRGDEPWVVLADPEGNEFCILTPRG